MYKPEVHLIDWPSLQKGAPYANDLTMLGTAKTAVNKCEITILTSAFMSRLQDVLSPDNWDDFIQRGLYMPLLPEGVEEGVFQIMADSAQGPNSTTIVYVRGTDVITMPLHTGGYCIGSTQSGEFRTPRVFDRGRSKADVDQYCMAVCTLIAGYEAMRRIPQVMQYESYPARRVVSKGRSTKRPAYRVMHFQPGSIVNVRRQYQERVYSANKRVMGEHDVNGHYRTLRRGYETCAHTYVDEPNAPKEIKREACTRCDARRVWIKAHKRGVGNDTPAQRVRIVS